MKKNFLKIFIFFMIIFLTPKVFADDFNVSSSITAPTCSGSSCSGGHYTSLEIYNSGSQNVYTVGTRYNGRISTMKFNVPLPSSWPDGSCYSTGDLSYTLTLNMATEDWRNYFSRPFISSSSNGTNWATSNVVFVNKKKIYFNFKIPSTSSCYDFLYVSLTSPNQSSTAFTGVSNWDLSSVILSVSFPSSSGSGSGSGSGGSTGATNQDIINANNQNTQDIITNNDKNTNNIINNDTNNSNNIIDNANQNTKDIIDNNNQNFNDCFNSFSVSKLNKGKVFTSQGELTSAWNGYYSNIYKISPYSTITISNSSGQEPGNWYILWDENMNFIDWYYMRNRVSSVPFNAVYFAYSTRDTNINVSIDTGFCTSKFDNIENGLNDINNSINDSNVDNGLGGSFFSDFNDNQHGLTGIITAPLNAIQSITSSSCVALNVPIPFTNGSVSLPCMTQVYEDNIPTVYNIWKIVSFGIIAYFICLDIFHIVKGFKDPESDKVEVLDL